jgi:hypothetical protein
VFEAPWRLEVEKDSLVAKPQVGIDQYRFAQVKPRQSDGKVCCDNALSDPALGRRDDYQHAFADRLATHTDACRDGVLASELATQGVILRLELTKSG